RVARLVPLRTGRAGRPRGALRLGSSLRRVLRGTRLGFQAPGDASAIRVVERLGGGATTDFGAPSIAPKADARPIDDAELKRLSSIMKACWRSFDAGVGAARGATRAKGA